jgi:hypothetical protein
MSAFLFLTLHCDRPASLKLNECGGRVSKQKREAKVPDDDPFAHLTAVERFAGAVERRDALTRDLRTPVKRGRDTTSPIYNYDGRKR